MLDEWAAHGQPTCSVLGLFKTIPGLCKLDQKRPCVGCLKLMSVDVGAQVAIFTQVCVS